MTATPNPQTGHIRERGSKVEYLGKSVEHRLGSRRALSSANELFVGFNTSATIPAGLVLTEDGTPAAAATYDTGLGGTAVLSSEATAAKAETLTGKLLWQGDRQTAGIPLVFETKVKLTTITSVELWCGFTDATNDTAIYALSSTSTFTTSVPTDAAVVGFSTTPTSGAAFTTGGNNHVALATKNDVDAVVATGLGAFAAATFYTYRVEVDSVGAASYFVDGKFLGRSAAALTKTVPLTPVVTVIPRTTSSRVATIDYIYVGGV